MYKYMYSKEKYTSNFMYSLLDLYSIVWKMGCIKISKF